MNAKIFMVRYLSEKAKAPSSGKFLTYREVPWGEVYFKQFQGRCLFRLAFGFGGKLDAFREIMERVGAQAISSGIQSLLRLFDHPWLPWRRDAVVKGITHGSSSSS